MRKYILITMLGLFCISCNGQTNASEKANTADEKQEVATNPKGNWKVNREFDENGNLIKYDSIYSYSSKDKFENLSAVDRDSMMQSFKSQFYRNYLQFENQGFENLFAPDSLFSKQFFNDGFFKSEFGNDLIDVEKLRHQMLESQKKFLEKYQSEFRDPEKNN